MGRFTKRPVTVEAVQFNKIGDHPAVKAGFGTGFCIEGRQGFVGVQPGDWIITEMNGAGFYPCKPDVFEATYVPAEDRDPAAMSFGDALRALKAGERVCRAGWNGKGMWLSLSGPPRGLEVVAERFWSANNAHFARRSGGTATVLPAITMKTATGEILMGWLASQTDMLAEDWMVLPADAA
ncbi:MULTISPECIES: DUF2829 domain-containing protein [unclassified Methylobacterium]|uniref:DUF2829 domain-containing protein n=1 Tax=unclassified Methylobacterium TaxID=2615210 RepID=UPI00068A0A29|nr:MULTISPECIES: DUF2829 domain-containing protein [unclassified Methylobacterium]SFV11780.1 Protein of unknown function [Methylobacterium sp. UNCCL125]